MRRRAGRAGRFASAVLLVLLACRGDGPGLDEDTVGSVTIAPGAPVLDLGDAPQFTATVRSLTGEAIDEDVTWKSSDEVVVQVTPAGVVTGVGPGWALITASAGGRTGGAVVTVVRPVAPSAVEAAPTSNTTVEVTWSDNSGNEAEFQIERSGGAGSGPLGGEAGGQAAQEFVHAGTTAPDVTLFTDTGLDPATSYRYRVIACHENGCSEPSQASNEVTTFNALTVETASLPDALLGTPYQATLVSSGGDGGNVWSLVGGDPLPSGLSLDPATGEIAGTPTAAGTSAFRVQVASGAETDQRDLSLTVTVPSVRIETLFLAGGYPGVAYDDAVTVGGGDGTVAFSITDGALPPGLTLDPADGSIGGAPTGSGVFHFTVEASSAGTADARTYMLTVSTRGPEGFNVFLHNLPSEMPSAALRSALDAAVAKLEEAITGDIPDFVTSSGFPGLACPGEAAHFNGLLIDDVEVLINPVFIDGSGGVLGSAGPCALALRPEEPEPVVMPILGRVTLDTQDLPNLDAIQLRGVVLHELLHVMGVGVLWSFGNSEVGHDFVTGLGTSNPRYTAPEGVAGYHEIGGTDDDVPVHGNGSEGDGSHGVHWRESTFDAELMTPNAEAAGVPTPFSAMTIRSLADLGWEVDVGAAETYSVSPAAPVAPPPAGAEEADPLYDLVPDIPIPLFSPGGTLLRVVGGG